MSNIFTNLVTLLKRITNKQREVFEQELEKKETLGEEIYQLLDDLPGAVLSHKSN
jgi:hypothetical protein